MTKADTTYNGWRNYETWAVKLWIDNEEPTYRYWQDATNSAWTEFEEPHSNAERSQLARIALADRLKDEHIDNEPDMEASVYSDLLGAALSDVDWFEIADALLNDADFDGYEARS